jgi:hypothetical protein
MNFVIARSVATKQSISPSWRRAFETARYGVPVSPGTTAHVANG